MLIFIIMFIEYIIKIFKKFIKRFSNCKIHNKFENIISDQNDYEKNISSDEENEVCL